MTASTALLAPAAEYAETRHHELRKTRILMIDGSLSVNCAHVRGRRQRARPRPRLLGLRVGAGRRRARPWCSTARAPMRRRCRASARARRLPLPQGSYRGEHVFKGRTPLSPKENVERLAALHAFCHQRYPACARRG